MALSGGEILPAGCFLLGSVGKTDESPRLLNKTRQPLATLI